MGFSCEIWQGDKKLTAYEDGIINYQLLNLGPNCSDETEAPNRVVDLRAIIASYRYASKLQEAAQDCFKELQRAVKENLQSLKVYHCCSCTCKIKEPKGWSIKVIEEILKINPKTITKISGGY